MCRLLRWHSKPRGTPSNRSIASRDDGELIGLKQQSEEIESRRTQLSNGRIENEQRQAQIRQGISEMETLAQRAEALR